MKRKLLVSIMTIGLLLVGTIPAKAIVDVKPQAPVRFIYINGSNNNTEQDKLNFISGIKRTQPYMKKAFETDAFVKENLLKNGQLYIKEEPKVFFWGYNSKGSLANIKDDLISLKMISPKMAQTVRTIIADVMHDAVWVQKENNMQIIIDNLHKDVMRAHNKGEKVVLFGHSAGSFVTYRYLFHKLPAISQSDLVARLEAEQGKKDDDFFRLHPIHPTCLDAISASKVGVYTTTGEFVVNSSEDLLKKYYLRLDEYTATQCVPKGEVLGIVNYGSPVALFYSDMNASTLEIDGYNMDFYRYLKDNNMFFLTVNFTDDPIGFPLGRNLTAEEIENLHNIQFNQEGRGFFYSKSDVRSPATFIGAHVSYWKYPKKFSQAVVKAYDEGYKNFYSD